MLILQCLGHTILDSICIVLQKYELSIEDNINELLMVKHLTKMITVHIYI